MRAHSKVEHSLRIEPLSPNAHPPCWLQPSGEHPEDEIDELNTNPAPTGREDLPYKVELWDEVKTSVELVLAVTANGSIGFAAYYAATREFPDRYITLRHKNSIISRWNGPGH
jgi:hypothetical protein